jgi:diguanylate cyclase (GGDEF)-like protein
MPVAGLLAEFISDRAEAFHFRFSDPFHAIVFALPLLLAIVFYRFGRERALLLIRLSAGEVIERELLHLSLHDRLTGLPNRVALEREAARFAAARNDGRMKPALLLLDLDKFKHVNDTLGHDAGDELLQVFAERVLGVLGPQERMFRLGGDEFVVTIGGTPDDADIGGVCQSIEACADAPFDLGAGRAVIGVSIGIARMEAGDGLPDVMRRADIALYAAKEVLGSAHVVHDLAFAEGVTDRMRTEQEIASGLLNNEFFVEYQPVVNAATREVSAFEALVRWRHPRRGVLTPDHFIAVAERSGHMLALGRFVLAQAIADAGRWPEAVGVSVNVTGAEFRAPHFVEFVRATLLANSVTPLRLTIEITEAVFAHDTDELRRTLRELRALGVKLAIDDFGLGFSSINRLRQFPVDRLKVDRSFTREMLQGGRGTELVEIMLRLGRVFDIHTTVEGIESEDQLEAARALGAADIQGFLISRPLAASAANAMAFGEAGNAAGMPLRFSA